MTARSWDMGDDEPTDDCSCSSDVWNLTTHGTWKGYKDGGKVYLDWPELLRRWGPVTEP